MKECPNCGLLNPDNSLKCDCGKNLDSVKVFDVNERTKLNRKDLVKIILIYLFGLPVIIYVFYKLDFDWRDAFSRLSLKFFDFFHIDYLYGVLFIAILPFYFFRKEIKNWKLISTDRKISILIYCLVFLGILLVYIIRLFD